MVAIGLEVVGYIALFLVCIMASAGGAGGGGVFVPCLLLFFRKDFEEAVILSQIIVLGNSFSQTFLNFGKRHPIIPKFPLIYWELIIVIQPSMLGGSNIGNILSNLLPPSILYVIALMVLCYAIFMSTKKAIHRYHEELESEKSPAAFRESDSKYETRASISAIDEVDDINETIASEVRLSTSAMDEVLRESLGLIAKQENERNFPLPVLRVIVIMWSCYLALLIGIALSGSCSTPYIVLEVALYIPLLCGSVWGVMNAQNLTRIFESAGGEPENATELANRIKRDTVSPIQESEELLKNRNQGSILSDNALTLSFCTFGIGIICALLGIGGGELLSPMMLSFHLMPQVVSATSGTLSFWNSMSLVIRACVLGKVPAVEGVFAIIIGLVGGFIGRKTGLKLSSKYNRSSFIIFSLVVILILSATYYVVELSIGDFDSSLGSIC